MSSPSPLSQDDFSRLLRKHFLGAAASLVLLVAIAAVLMVQFRPELDSFTAAVFAAVGIWGLVGLIFFTDTFVSPFPPDSVLILIAASPYHQHWHWLIPAVGAASFLAGCLGYGCGKLLSNKSWALRWFDSMHSRNEEMVARYGPWAVALGAMTPVPFSITCWTAGLLRLKFSSFMLPALLRIPRYVIYYAAIAYFPRLVA